MSRPYNRNRQPRQKSPGSRQFIVAFAAFLAGYLVSNVFDVSSLGWWINKQLVTHQKGEAKPEVIKTAKPKELPKPKFEFYTLLSKDSSAPAAENHTVNPSALPKEKEEANLARAAATVVQHSAPVTESKPVVDIKSVVANKPIIQPTVRTPSHEGYLVQVASFNRVQDAEHLKASLTLQGFDVNLTSTAQNNITWYRVNLGPYASREEALKAQAMMSRGGRVRGIVRKIEG